MKREFSAGGVVFNSEGKVLLINNAALRDPKKSYWGFPKGHINTGEKSEQAAVREVEEETGIKAEIVKKLGDSSYIYIREGEKVFKVVVMFLMKYISGEIKHQPEELLDAGWVTVEEAMNKLSFKKDREFLEKALLESKVIG